MDDQVARFVVSLVISSARISGEKADGDRYHVPLSPLHLLFGVNPMSMPQSISEYVKGHFWNYVLKLAAVATFVVAGSISGMLSGTPTWAQVQFFFFVSGVLGFLVAVPLNKGRNIKDLAGMAIALAFLPEVLAAGFVAVLVGIPLLILLIVWDALFGTKILGRIAGFLLKIIDWIKSRASSTPAHVDATRETGFR